MKIFRFILYLVIILFFISSKSHSQESFVITSELLEIIPNEHLSFLEGFDETASFDTLENVEWSEKRYNAQSMVNGYWVRFSIKNNLSTDSIGLSHNFNREKKIFIKNSLGTKEYDYWKLGLTKHKDDNHIGSEFKLFVPKGETTTIYNFFRNKPVDRFNSKANYHRMMIGAWDTIRAKEFWRSTVRAGFATSAILFGIYYFFVYLISKGNYLWISLALLLISFLSLMSFLTEHLGIYFITPSLSSVSNLIFIASVLFLVLIQFFRKTLDLSTNFPRLDKFFMINIFFYLAICTINLLKLLNWPNEELLDMVKHPPDNLGPGIIKFHQFAVPFIILLVISIAVAFLNWRKGSKSSGYLFISFLLPFLALPIAAITYLIFDGFNWYFWSIVQPTISILFLGMFVTFGFSVAQGMNDLKQEFIDKQLKLNN